MLKLRQNLAKLRKAGWSGCARAKREKYIALACSALTSYWLRLELGSLPFSRSQTFANAFGIPSDQHAIFEIAVLDMPICGDGAKARSMLALEMLFAGAKRAPPGLIFRSLFKPDRQVALDPSLHARNACMAIA